MEAENNHPRQNPVIAREKDPRGNLYRQSLDSTVMGVARGAGIAGAEPKRLNRRTMRDLIRAWMVTTLVAGLIAGVVYTVVVSF